MAASAGASLLRGFVVAMVVSPPAFTTYVSTVALGAFFAAFLSFGSIESTTKQFPRISVSGNPAALLGLSNRVVATLSARAAICLLLLVLVVGITDRSQLAWFASALLIAYAASVTSVIASLQRALFNSLHLALSAVSRALVSLALVVGGAFYFGLAGALGAEIVAALLGGFLSRVIAKKTLGANASTALGRAADAGPTGIRAERGLTLFAAYAALSVPFYLDRVYVSSVFSAPESAAYALTTLFLTAASVLVNIVCQKVGPELIGQEKLGVPLPSLIRTAAKWSGFTIIAWILLIGSAAALTAQGWIPQALTKYAVTDDLFFVVGLLGCVQISSLFEFILLAHDKERRLLTAAIGYLLLVAMIAAGAALVKLALVNFVALLALAKLLYLVSLLLSLYRPNPVR